MLLGYKKTTVKVKRKKNKNNQCQIAQQPVIRFKQRFCELKSYLLARHCLNDCNAKNIASTPYTDPHTHMYASMYDERSHAGKLSETLPDCKRAQANKSFH